MSRPVAVLLVVATLVIGGLVGVVAAGLAPGLPETAAGPTELPTASPSVSPSVAPTSATPSATSTPTATASAPPTPSQTPSPTPVPTPVLVPAPLTGLLVPEAMAQRHVVAVMVDDQRDARPQSGFSAASVVWQAPAEGGIPRYMLLFQEGEPASVGPVRSARHYFISWAAEWRAMYVHVGGSPLALRTLRSADGRGGLVYDADEFRYGGKYLWRIPERLAPHNVYTDDEALRALLRQVGAQDGSMQPAWQFADDATFGDRPVGGQLDVPYLANQITYRYDRATNRYLRGVTGAKAQVDLATNERVAPKNVVVILMHFEPLADGSAKHRLEADVVGRGTAYIATNGRTIKGTWSKASTKAPTLLFDAAGVPVTLTRGQTFVQVVPIGTRLTIRDGKVPAKPTRPDGAGDLESRGPSPE